MAQNVHNCITETQAVRERKRWVRKCETRENQKEPQFQLKRSFFIIIIHWIGESVNEYRLGVLRRTIIEITSAEWQANEVYFCLAFPKDKEEYQFYKIPRALRVSPDGKEPATVAAATTTTKNAEGKMFTKIINAIRLGCGAEGKSAVQRKKRRIKWKCLC